MPLTSGQKLVAGAIGALLLIFVAILIAWAAGAFDKKAESTSSSSDSTTEQAAAAQTPLYLTKFIRVHKELSPALAAIPANNVFQIGELKVYDSGALLPASAFSDVKYSAGGSYDVNNAEFSLSHLLDGNLSTWMATSKTAPTEIMLTLAVPANVTSLEVYNHPTCCKDQLAGVRIDLMDAQGATLWSSSPLTDANLQTLTPLYGASSFQGFASSVSSVGQRIKGIFTRSAFQGIGPCYCNRAIGCRCRASGMVSKQSTSIALRNAAMLR